MISVFDWFSNFLILLLGFTAGLFLRWPFFEFDLFARSRPKIPGIDIHSHPFGQAGRIVRACLFCLSLIRMQLPI